MNKVSRSEYSKAYYNNRKRKEVNIKSEMLTPELAKFIVNHGESQDFFELFGNNLEYLITTQDMSYREKKITFLVVRTKLDKIIGYSRFDTLDKRVLRGDSLRNMQFTTVQIQQLLDNEVDISILNLKLKGDS